VQPVQNIRQGSTPGGWRHRPYQRDSISSNGNRHVRRPARRLTSSWNCGRRGSPPGC